MGAYKNLLNKYRNMNVQAKAAIWYTICNILQKGISFFVVPIYVRLLTVVEYGRYATFQSWREILIIFATLNLYCGVFTRGLVKHSDDKESYTSSMQSLGTIITILFFGIYIGLSNFWNSIFQMDTTTMLLMFAYFVFNPALNFWSTKQRVEYKYKKMVAVTMLTSILIPVVSLILLYCTDLREKSVIWGYLFVQTAIGLFFYIFNLIKGKSFYKKEYWVHGLKFNIPLIPHYLSLIILGQCDRIMIQKMCGDAEVGMYSLAYQVAIIMNVFISAINNSIVPWQYENIKVHNEKKMGSVCTKIASFIALMILFIIMIAPEVIMVLGTKEYMSAVWIIPPIALSSYFTFCYGLFSTIEFYYGKTHYVTIASTVGAVINIILNYIFISLFGFVAAGFTTLFCYIVLMLMHYFFMRKVCKINNTDSNIYNTKFLFGFGFIILATIPIFMVLYNYSIVRYILIGIGLILLIIFHKKIINFIKSIFNKKEGVEC